MQKVVGGERNALQSMSQQGLNVAKEKHLTCIEQAESGGDEEVGRGKADWRERAKSHGLFDKTSS